MAQKRQHTIKEIKPASTAGYTNLLFTDGNEHDIKNEVMSELSPEVGDIFEHEDWRNPRIIPRET